MQNSHIDRVTEFSVVSEHASPESCWVILYGKVYDVRVPNDRAQVQKISYNQLY